MRHRGLRPLALSGLLVACEGPLPVAYETEHLRIGVDLDHPLWAGDLVAFEEIFRRVEDELGFTKDSKVSVWIWSDEAWPSVREKHCRSDPSVLGCISYLEDTIYTSWDALEHELAHAAISIPGLTPFFGEALADVYGGAQTRFGNTAPADSLALSGADIDRWTARHFVMWLRETWGGAKLGELARLKRSAGKNFEKVYGMSFAEAQEKYFAEAPWGYPGLYSCGGAPLDYAEELGGWRAVVDLDCGAGEDVRVAGIGRMTSRTFVIPVAGYYAVSTDAAALSLRRCATGPTQEPPRRAEHDDDDVPPSYAGELWTEEFAFYEGGAILDLYFEPGKHQIELFLLGYDEGEANLAIWPTLGPRPVTEEGAR